MENLDIDIKKIFEQLNPIIGNLIRNTHNRPNQPNQPDYQNSEILQLSPIDVIPEYRKKWNAHLDDFVCLTRNGELISNFLYRVGGLNTPNLKRDRYFMLMKQVEAYYPDHITKIAKDKPHLESRWCIFDKNGVEKVELACFKHPYLVRHDSCLYSVDGKYYNIETGEFYGSGDTMQSDEFLFLENSYDQDKSKRGVLKINKIDGTWELFSKK